MEQIESSMKVVTVVNKAKDGDSVSVPLSKQKQEYIKDLILSSFHDPREDYKPVNMDDLEYYWSGKQGC